MNRRGTDYKNLLLVEGFDDQYVVRELLKFHQIPCIIPDRPEKGVKPTDDTIRIYQTNGFDALRDELDSVLDRINLERLGIIVDADTNILSRWDSLRSVLNNAGAINMPEAPEPNGTIFQVARPDRTLTVGVWLMPDNTLPGILEDFIELLVPAGDTLLPRAQNCLAQIPESERRFRPADAQKALIYTWLAWQENPGTPLGQAITATYLDADAPRAGQLAAWMRLLFL